MKQSLLVQKFREKPHHAYIISGRAGSGKKELAARFAKSLLCEGNGGEDCRCVPCKTFDSGNHPDVIYVRAVKAKSIGVNDVREQVVAVSEIKPYSSAYKIFVMEEAELMTAQAQNALLKTLEEPPAYGVFLLLTQNTDMLLPTVLSRCVTVKLSPPPIETVIQTAEFSALRNDALKLLCEIETAARNRNYAALFTVAAKIGEYKNDINALLDIFYLTYRDAAACVSIGETAVIQKDVVETIKEIAGQKSALELTCRAEAVFTAGQRLKCNANFQLTVEVMLLDFMEV